MPLFVLFLLRCHFCVFTHSPPSTTPTSPSNYPNQHSTPSLSTPSPSNSPTPTPTNPAIPPLFTTLTISFISHFLLFSGVLVGTRLPSFWSGLIGLLGIGGKFGFVGGASGFGIVVVLVGVRRHPSPNNSSSNSPPTSPHPTN